MKTTYFKTVIQKTTETHSILVAVIPNEMLGDLPTICEMEAFKMPASIYTGTYPQIKLNTHTLKDRKDLIGLGIDGILQQPIWFDKTKEDKDILGIGI